MPTNLALGLPFDGSPPDVVVPELPKTVDQTFDDQAISRYIEGQPNSGSLTGINAEKEHIVMSASLQSVPELSPTEYLLDVEEVARRLNVSPQWVRDHSTRRTPKLPCVRLGSLLRFRPKDVDTFIEQQSQLPPWRRRRTKVF